MDMTYYVINEDVTYRIVEKDAILLDFDKGEHYTLNRTGTEVLEWIKGNKSLADIINLMKEKYPQAEMNVEEDVRRLMSELLEKKIVKVKEK